MMTLELSDGTPCVVDDEDFPILSQWIWHSHKNRIGNCTYAIRNLRKGEPRDTPTRMHRFILGLKTGDCLLADHINGNGLDNRKVNLRVADKSENAWNIGRFRHNTSGYKGVSYKKDKRRWRATINVKGKQILVGLFKDPQKAHEAYCRAAIKYHGEFANFGSHQTKENSNEHHTS